MTKINGTHVHHEEKPELIYVYDALCGWCYGFSPVISKLKEELNEKFDFLVLSGGMVRGDQVVPISEMYDFLKQAYKEVEKRTGVVFGVGFLEGVLEKGDAKLNSEPPALAMAAFRLQKQDLSVEFASAIQSALYYDGMHSEDMEGYSRIAGKFGVDELEFEKKIKDPEVEQIMQNEFRMVSQMGVRGYPTVLLRKGEEMSVISRGYMKYDDIKAALLNSAGLA